MASRTSRLASALVLDDEGDAVDYRRGPGRRTCTPGAVTAAYVVTGAWNTPCPNCAAEPGQYCRHPSGHERKMPCPQRIREIQP